MTYITVPIETDETVIADDAIARLQTAWNGWEPNDGDIEVLLIEVLAAVAEAAAVAAAQVPDAVFEAIASQLHSIAIREGTPATTEVSFTADAATFVPAGTELDIDGYAFTTDNDGTTPFTIGVTSVETGARINNLDGDVVSILSAAEPSLAFTVDAPTAGGTDEETLSDYRERAVGEMQLQAKTLVTLRDYELMALSLPTVGRVIAVQDVVNKEVEVYPLSPTGALLTGVTGPPPTLEKLELATLLEQYRVTNWDLVIADPEVTQVNVTYAVVMYPGYLAADVVAACDAALTDYLDPLTWGEVRAISEPTGTFLNEKVVRKNKIIDILGGVPGVNYVTTVTLADGGTGSGTVEANGDYTMNGNAPLADAATLAGTAT